MAVCSVATYARCGGIFNNHFTANSLGNRTVKEFRKSVARCGGVVNNQIKKGLLLSLPVKKN